jgi:DNA (cytosine-5)-methyltransferase 1
MGNLHSLKNGDSDSLAAITHAIQAGEPLPLYLRSAEKTHLRAWSGVVQERLKGYDTDQLIIPFALDQLLDTNVRLDVPFPPPRNPKFTFIDLFAGIGGMRLAFQGLGGKCVFSSEIDPYAKHTYEVNFGEVPFGDITKIDENDVPDHDVLVGGFPCQAFSIAGRRMGFEEARGTLFFDIARIIDQKRPRAIFLENVKGLVNHKGGETLRVILRILRDDLGYTVPDPQIMNAKYFGVPQNRERIFIVGFRDSVDAVDFSYPARKMVSTCIADILETEPVDAKYYLSRQYLTSIREHRRRHEAKGHGFGYEIIPSDGVANAIVVGGMGRERNLVIDHRIVDRTPTTNIKGGINDEDIRRMTPREWARLQGFPDTFLIPVSDAQAYKQFGNSVAVPAISATARIVLRGVCD